ncbi:MAG: agmatine deiminase family protein [Candidatus Pacebacteria bacterium]|nr:agmatine deiminase family protein [Candidatus Paceibacterota bacterium]MBP9839447.1 agmatine deiminase family protein [Candidatus Paceibacterota bacterium]
MSQELQKDNSIIMPGEWEEHVATWLAWPNDRDFFQDRFSNVEKIYTDIIHAIHRSEVVKLVVLNLQEENRIKSLLKDRGIDLSRIVFFHTEYVDVWMRDYGPTFIKNDLKNEWVKWNYDGYGGTFPELFKDDKVFISLKDSIPFEMHGAEFAMEGGAIDVNGKGTVLTTKECLIENRNLGKSKEETENVLKKYLGVKNIIWLNKGLTNDHTDGHIDEVARFVNPSKILIVSEDNPEDENYERLLENFNIISDSKDQDGNKFEVIKLPMPHMRYDDGSKAPVSYANFYITNKIVLVSVFQDENDEKAVNIIKSCFPDKEIVTIDCRDLIYGGGAIHCITQQEPA